MIVQQLPTQDGNLQPQTTHPLGSKARVLLTSVFGPYAQDDGSEPAPCRYVSRRRSPVRADIEPVPVG
jgi:hypothetical protein